ncbi:hypothetical protein NQ318_016823 [Aromia moschata]|uniref:Titin n=1 Tax=Aromia moschata TaxID=1265417 RepID=A0AAV8YV83_9CUCU|nr:hypothetical protein NQ318_016823 [Aromia moschata]
MQIVTVEEEGKKPQSTVTIEEVVIPEETVKELPESKSEPTMFIEELPEVVTVMEVKTKEGPKKQVIKKRVIRKRKGSKQESTEIVTVEEEGKKPETTVTVEEIDLPKEVIKELPSDKQEPIPFIVELPEEVIVTEVKTEEGPKKQITKKEKEGRKPQSTVTIEETEVPEETAKEFIEELPEEITVTEVKTDEGTKKQIIKKRVIKTRKGGKQKSTEIVTVEEEGKKPQTTVTVEETEIPESLKDVLPVKQEPTSYIEEVPEEVTVTEINTEEGPKKQVTRRKVIKTRKGSKQESVHIVTVEEEGKKPQSTVTIEEIEVPEEILKELPLAKPEPATFIEELPEQVTITEVKTDQGPKKQVTKTRTIRTRKGGKLESTEIVTVEEEGKKPQTTVTVEETEISDEGKTPEETVKEQPSDILELVEELPEVVRDIQQSTEIVTIEEEGKKPQTTVTVEEIELPEEPLNELPALKSDQTTILEELPEEVIVTQIETKEGPKKRVTKKRVIKKRVDDKEENTEIFTVEEEGKTPETTVTVTEIELPKEETKKRIKKGKKPDIKDQVFITEDNILFVPTLAQKKDSGSEDIIDLVQKELLKKALSQPVVPEVVQREEEETEKKYYEIKKEEEEEGTAAG